MRLGVFEIIRWNTPIRITSFRYKTEYNEKRTLSIWYYPSRGRCALREDNGFPTNESIHHYRIAVLYTGKCNKFIKDNEFKIDAEDMPAELQILINKEILKK